MGNRDELLDLARSISHTAAGVMVPPQMDIDKLAPRIQEKKDGRWIVHICTFDQPISRIDFEKYVESVLWFGYHPCGYGGGSYPLPLENEAPRKEWRWQHWDSCD